MKVLEKKLKNFKRKNELIAFYFNIDNLKKFDVGYIDIIEENILRIKAISPEGLNDGYMLRKVSDIIKIEKDSLYLKRLKKMIENLNYLDRKIEISKKIKEDTLTDSFREAKKNNILVTLYFDENDSSIILTGYIKEIEDETITIDIIDEYGRKDGEQIINIEIIDQIDINSIDNRKIELMLDSGN